MLHGHAKIELTNVKTGEKKVVEHDNMLTNWIADIFTPRGVAARNITSMTGYAALNKTLLFRGLVMFQNILSNDADDYAFPIANRMIAHGYNIAYSGSDTSQGSYNELESSIGTDNATFVWDFNQNQGNGTISSLGLCNQYAGQIGAGQRVADSPTSKPSLAKYSGKMNRESISTFGANRRRVVYVSYSDNKAYYIKSFSSGVLTIGVMPFGANSIDILVKDVPSNLYDFMNGESEFTVDISAYISGSTMPMFKCDENGILYAIESGNWSNGASKTIVKIDLATKTVTTQSITNNTGKTILSSGGSGSYCDFFGTGYMLFQTSDKYIVYISLSDNTDCGVVKDADGNDILLTSTGYKFFTLGGKVYFRHGATYTSETDSSPTMVMVAKDTALQIASRGIYGDLSSNVRDAWCARTDNPLLAVFGTDTFSSQYTLQEVYDILCLSTKQNLDTPVTKTADMTMRVTYTIREVSE